MMRTLSLVVLAGLASSAHAQTRTATSETWQDQLLAGLTDADPTGGWDLVPASPEPMAAKTKADILIESLGNATTASHHGNVTLKRGIVSAWSTDGTQAMLHPDAIEVCDELGCEIIVEERACIAPLCGGYLALAESSTAYMVADVELGRDGSTSFVVTDLLVAFDTAFAGVEPEEID